MVQTLRMLESNVDNKRYDEPNSLNQAIHHTDWFRWKDAIKVEYDSLIEKKTWELTSMPENQQVITGRWCFKLKKDRNGQILKYKARWVAHGLKQEERVDFVETFAAVVKPMLYKCSFRVSVKCGYKIRQMDVLTAFLYGFRMKSYTLSNLIFLSSTQSLFVVYAWLYMGWSKLHSSDIRPPLISLKNWAWSALSLTIVFLSQKIGSFALLYMWMTYFCLLLTNHASQISRTNSAPDSKWQTWGKYLTT